MTERNGRKTLTTVQGLPKKFDQKKILKVIKKKFGLCLLSRFEPVIGAEPLAADAFRATAEVLAQFVSIRNASLDQTKRVELRA